MDLMGHPTPVNSSSVQTTLIDKRLADLFIKFFSAIKAVVNEEKLFFPRPGFNIARPVLEFFLIDALDFANYRRLFDSRTFALGTANSFAHEILLRQPQKILRPSLRLFFGLFFLRYYIRRLIGGHNLKTLVFPSD